MLILVLPMFVACGSKSGPGQSGNNSGVRPAKPPTKVTYAVNECSFEKYVPGEGAAPLSEYGKALMYRLGTGILKQKDGSLCKLHCPNGDSFPAWIDFDGKPVSALYGLGWMLNSVEYSPGRSQKPHLWENRGGWLELAATFDDRTSPLPAGSRSSSATYTIFSDGSLSESSARLLRYFGIGVAGRESIVKLSVADYSGTGVLSASGVLKVENETSWTAPVE
jgi:hypothetical protein